MVAKAHSAWMARNRRLAFLQVLPSAVTEKADRIRGLHQ